MDARVRQIDETISKLRAERQILQRETCSADAPEPQNFGACIQAPREKSPEEIIEDLFTYHPATIEQQLNYERVRDAAKHLALQIWKACPYGRDRTNAIDSLRVAVMQANAAIALQGRNL